MYKEILCNFDNLYEAYRKSHRSKTNSPDVIEFDKNKIYNINKILKLLETKQWDKIFIYYRFTIKSPKTRIVDAMKFEGRIVQHVLCDKILKPYFEKRLIFTNAACRENKGTEFAIRKTVEYLTSYLKANQDGYVLKMDVKKYFPHIDKSILKNMLNDFPDKEIKELMFFIIDYAPEELGIPIGNQTSQWFALYYLDKLDRVIKEQFHIKYYIRYMDDMIIIHQNKELLSTLLEKLKTTALQDLKLEFNDKTQLFPLHKGFSFLSWRFIIDNKKIIKKLSRSKKKQRLSRYREIQKAYRIHKDNERTHYERMHSLYANLKKGDTYKFIFALNLYKFRLTISEKGKR